MSETKKNPLAAVVFFLMVIVLPLITVYFSKFGLDAYKDLRSEMPFLKDSIRVNFNDLNTYWNAELNNEFIKEKMVFVAFADNDCKEKLGETIDFLKKILNKFEKDDQHKMLFVVHAIDETQDSTWSLEAHVKDWQLDTSAWKFTKNANLQAYLLKPENKCPTIVLLDGRVSRKDKTNNYKKGPLLCAHYNIKDEKTLEQLLKHIPVLMPKKERKSIQYKAEEKLY